MESAFSVSFRYSLHSTRDVFSPDNPLLASLLDGRALIAIEREVAEQHPGLIQAIEAYFEHHGRVLVHPPLVLPGGEQSKNHPEVVVELLSEFRSAGLCRHSYVVAIGGGALLDVVGFGAAIAHRGLRLIRVPTTVLAQCDSGVGVKNAINLFGNKNFVGCFAPPFAVLNDAAFLDSLPTRELRAGLAEIVKVALLKDASFFANLERDAPRLLARDTEALSDAIHRSAVWHMHHIATAGDPFEQGSSRPLDLGHWAAHKLELLTDHALRHGEAVAIGLALDSTYSCRKGLLPTPAWQRIMRLLETLGFALYHPALAEGLDEPDHPRSVLRGLGEFREHLGGPLTVPLLSDIGHMVEAHEMDTPLIIECIRFLQRTHARKGGPRWTMMLAPAR